MCELDQDHNYLNANQNVILTFIIQLLMSGYYNLCLNCFAYLIFAQEEHDKKVA